MCAITPPFNHIMYCQNFYLNFLSPFLVLFGRIIIIQIIFCMNDLQERKNLLTMLMWCGDIMMGWSISSASPKGISKKEKNCLKIMDIILKYLSTKFSSGLVKNYENWRPNSDFGIWYWFDTPYELTQMYSNSSAYF